MKSKTASRKKESGKKDGKTEYGEITEPADRRDRRRPSCLPSRHSRATVTRTRTIRRAEPQAEPQLAKSNRAVTRPEAEAAPSGVTQAGTGR